MYQSNLVRVGVFFIGVFGIGTVLSTYLEVQYRLGIRLGEVVIGICGLLALNIAYRGLTITLPTLILKEGLRDLNPLPGNTLADVIDVLGPSHELLWVVPGRVVRHTWSTPRFGITIEFTDGFCTTVIAQRGH